jgi:GTPase SAR1 family protein
MTLTNHFNFYQMSKKTNVEEEKISVGIFGDSGIGKTTIVIQFLNNIFVEEHGFFIFLIFK